MHNALWVATLEDSGAATWEFTCLQRKPKEIPGNPCEEFQSASDMHQTLQVSPLVQAGAATQDFSSLCTRTNHLGRCLGGVLGSSRAWTCFPFLSAINGRASINRMAAVSKSSKQSYSNNQSFRNKQQNSNNQVTTKMSLGRELILERAADIPMMDYLYGDIIPV